MCFIIKLSNFEVDGYMQEKLNEILDVRHEGTSCEFNGYLEDYLGLISEEDPEYTCLSTLLALDRDLKVIKDYRCSLSKESTSNIIIRYKDANKIKNNHIVCDYILYNQNDKVVVLGSDYIYAKALFYVLSETPNVLTDYRKDTLVLAYDTDPEAVKDGYGRLKGNAIFIQQEIDKQYLGTYEEISNTLIARSEAIMNEIKNYEYNHDVKRFAFIEDKIIKTFLLKKFIYVHYMLDRNVLKNVHQMNVKEQRTEAKRLSNLVRFIPFQEMWEYTNTNRRSEEEAE